MLPPPEPAPRASPYSTEAYAEELVVVPNGAVRLAGTLSVPRGVHRPPAVVLVSGSGPQDRDETVATIPIFRIVAEALARHGLAVLRMDKRGTGESTGTFKAATTADFASDAQAGIAFLRSSDRFGRVGILGHSEGGYIAPLVASHDREVAFAILLAPPTVSFEQVMLDQIEFIGEADGHPVARAVLDLNRLVYDGIRQGNLADLEKQPPPPGVSAEVWHKGLAEAGQAGPAEEWLLRYDPAPALESMRCPTLALFGALDLQVLPSTNVPALERLARARHEVTVQVIPGLNHLFQRASTGSPSEYGSLAKIVDPTMLDALTTWVDRHVVRLDALVTAAPRVWGPQPGRGPLRP